MPKYFLVIAVLFLFLASCAPKNTNALSQPTPVKTSLDTQSSTAIPNPEIEVGVVVVSTLNVREGPGTSYPAIGALNKGEKFYILGETTNSTNDKWFLLRLSDHSFGWVVGQQSYVTVQKQTVDLDTYSTWQKNVAAAKTLIPVTSP